MSSYYPSFNYNNLNSLKDKHLLVTHFESGDSGEMDTFLGMEPIYTDSPYGTKRIDYGAKYNNVAVIRISVMKTSGQDFSVAEVRDFLKWTTGSRQISYLDLVDGDNVVASFLGRITSVYQQKFDARTIGFVIEHTSVSPWAYSPQQFVYCSFGQKLTSTDGVLTKNGESLYIDDSGTISNDEYRVLNVTNDGVVYIDSSVIIDIDNMSDDLYSYVYPNTIFTNINSTSISIKNVTLEEETLISGVSNNEVIRLSSEQFISSDIPNKIFGNSFNFVWPRFAPGVNELHINGDHEGSVEFVYRYPIKIGDCAIDIAVNGSVLNGDDAPDRIINTIHWGDIIDTPTTISGYNITDAYTTAEVDTKIATIDSSVDDAALNYMLNETLGQ